MTAIFDMDGTLLDSMGMWSGIGDRYVKQRGYPFLGEFRLVVSDKTYNEKVQEFIGMYGLKTDVPTLKAEFDRMVEEDYYFRLELKPGVREFLEVNREKGVQMCVATATASHLARACLERLGVLKYFSLLLSTRDTGVNKFSPDVYLRCAAHMGSLPCETTVYEDALYAAKSAFFAGFRVVGVYDAMMEEDYLEMQRMGIPTIRGFSQLLG